MSINAERLTTLARRHLEVLEAENALNNARVALREAERYAYLQPEEGAQTIILPQGDLDLAVTMKRGNGGSFDYAVSEVVNG